MLSPVGSSDRSGYRAPKASLEPGPALYVVATPIGNLEDISLRAVRILQNVDLILSEDTRKTGRLLKYYGIDTKLKSYRTFRREEDEAFALKRLKAGANLALVSEAGTPGVSDPGSQLVRLARQERAARIVPVPGPSAAAAALSICGWQTNPAIFIGFPSSRAGRRRRLLEECRLLPGALVFYESVHRIKQFLQELRQFFPDREIMIAREMTKLHEEALLLPIGTEIETELPKLTLKGEFTIILAPPR